MRCRDVFQRVIRLGRQKARASADPQKDEAERRLSITMPMAGVGAQRDGEYRPTETEQELKRAADENGP
jgi:hypothetical protein